MRVFVVLLFSLQVQATQFAAFQKMLESFVKETTLENGGIQTSFSYGAAFSDARTAKWIGEQKQVLKDFDPKKLTKKNDLVAFWINAYNFFMIEKIYREGWKGKLTISSVKDMGSFFSPYGAFTDKEFVVGGKKFSLDDIEKGTLLGDDFKKRKFKDARVHFAVNCASVGCPPLIKKVYSGETLDDQLNLNTKRALQTKRHLSIKGKTLRLTHLFKWYRKDFEEEAKSVAEWIKKFRELPSFDEIEYIEYDWKLNKPGNFKADGSE